MPITAAFDALSGTFAMTLPATASGSAYTVTARHALYLANEITLMVYSGGSYPLVPTTLKGGDASVYPIRAVLAGATPLDLYWCP